jgi:hypothetical protein
MTTPLRHADIDDAIPASGTQLADRGKTNALLKRIAFHAAAAPAAVERAVQERLADVVSIKDFGARGELARASDISTTAASTTVTAAAARWSEADVGKWIFIEGAGDYNGSTLFRSTITEVVSSTQVTIADPAVNTTSGAYAEWGSDDTTPFRDAIAWCRDNGKELFMPSGAYTVDPGVMNTAIPINDNGRLVIRGAGPSTILRRMGASMEPTRVGKILRLESDSGGFRLVQLSDLEIDGNNVQNPPPEGSSEQIYSQAASVWVAGTATSVIDLVVTRNLTLRNGMGDHLRVGVGEADFQVRVNCWMIENIVERDRATGNGRAAAIIQASVARVFVSNIDSVSRATQHEFNQVPLDREVYHHYNNIVMYRWKMSEGSRFVNTLANQVRVTGYVSSLSLKRGRFVNCDLFPHSPGGPASEDPEDDATSIPVRGYSEFIGCTIRARIDVRWKGPWIDGAYDERDGVSHNESAWVAVAPVLAGQEPGVHASWEEIGPSNTTAFGLRLKWATGIPAEVKFTRCRFIIEAPAIVGNVAGFAMNESTVVHDTDPTLRRVTFEECDFDPRFQRSIFARRHGDYITKRCRFQGWEYGIWVTATSERRQSWTSIDDDFSGAAVPFHARNTAGLVRLGLRHSGLPFAQAAWSTDGWSDDAGHVSTRLLWIDAADLVGGQPEGGGIAGDRARLRKPVAGGVAEWICTVSHPTAATWKALTSVAA